MFEKNMKISFLIDFYIDLLDQHTVDILKAYYDDDLSLAEIASTEGISRQGIRHIIKKGEELILFYEEKLQLARRYSELCEVADKLQKVKSCFEGHPDKEALVEVIDGAIQTILNKGV